MKVSQFNGVYYVSKFEKMTTSRNRYSCFTNFRYFGGWVIGGGIFKTIGL